MPLQDLGWRDRIGGFVIMRYLLIGAVALSTLGTAVQAGPLVNQLTNGSFEDGFNGWTVGGVSDDGFPPVVIGYGNNDPYPTGAFGEAIPVDNAVSPSPDPAAAHAAYFVADMAHPQTLSQVVNLVAGQTYEFGFDVYVPFNGAANPNDASLSAVVGGLNFASFNASSLGAGNWFHYAATGVAGSSGTTSFDFNFNSFGIPAKDFVIDRVYFGAVPEPASWAMMVGGFGLIGSAMRRRTTRIRFA